MQRVSAAAPCEKCGATKWCARSDDGQLLVCMRSSDGALRRTRDGAGWLHVIGEARRPPGRRLAVVSPPPDWTDFAAERCAATSDADLQLLADEINLPLAVPALRALSVSWSWRRNAWAHPMRDARGRCIGVRLRRPDGDKFSAPGGREGLFLSAGAEAGELLFAPEGATDSVALASLGLHVAGRPCATGGAQLLAEIARGKDLVVVADNDDVGAEGAWRAAAAALPTARSVRVVVPPEGCDAREWVAWCRPSAADALTWALERPPVRPVLRRRRA